MSEPVRMGGGHAVLPGRPAPPPTSSAPPRARRPLGRRDEIRVLAELGTAIAGGEGRALFVSGDAGMGKSRIVGVARRMAENYGALVLSGHCSRTATAPYAPLVGAVRRHTRLAEHALLEQYFAGGARLALTLFPEIAVELGVIGASPAVDPEDLDAAVWQLFAHLAGDRPVVLFIEDLHWAGPDMLRLLCSLIREVQGIRLGVLCTYRTDVVHRGHPLMAALGELARSRSYEELELGPLDREHVATMLGQLLGENVRIEDGFVQEVVDRTGGNPFYIEELCKALVVHGAKDVFARGALDAVEVPATVRDVILERVEHLDPDALRALQIAALAGARLDQPVIARAAGIDHATVQRIIVAGLERRWLVERRDDSTHEYAFRHVLTREALGAELIGPNRSDAHRRIADAIRDIHGDELDAYAARLADHYAESGDVDQARALATRAARRAAESGAPEEAILRYLQAVQLCPDNAADRLDLLVEVAEALTRPGRQATTLDIARQARDLARARGDRAAESRATGVLAWERWWSGDYESALTLSQESLKLVEGRGDRWELRALMALAHRQAMRDDYEAARALLARAGTLATRLNDPAELARLHNARGLLGGSGTNLEEAYAEALTQAEAAGDSTQQVMALILGGWSFHMIGELDRARTLWRQAVEVADRAVPHLAVWVGLATAGLEAYAGNLDVAQEGVERWLPRASDSTATFIACCVEAEIHLRRGNVQRAAVLARRARQIAGDTQEGMRMVPVLAVLGRVGLHEGVDAVSAYFEEAMRRSLAGTSRYLGWIFVGDYARLLYDASDVERLEAWVADARRLVDLAPTHQPNIASLHLCEGMLAAAHGDLAVARTRARAGAELFATIGLASREADARLLLAALERSAGRVDSCVNEAEAARRIGQRINASTITAHAASILRQEGVRVAGERGVASTAGGLSTRERHIAALVARGMSNAEIAHQLFLSERTVRNHVSNILAKLELRRRAEVARWATENRLLESD